MTFVFQGANRTFALQTEDVVNMITTVIFDLDGTLLDTLQDLTNSVNFALRAHGLPERTSEEVRSFLGNGYTFLISHAANLEQTNERTTEILSTFSAYYEKHCLDLTKPYTGIMQMLEKLKAQGIKMAIVSNKGNEAVQELNTRFFRDYVTIAVGESKVVRRKPNPDSVLAALEQLGGIAAECIYVGDSEVDIATARNAKVRAVTCTWGFRDTDFLLQHGAETLINSPYELIDLLMK